MYSTLSKQTGRQGIQHLNSGFAEVNDSLLISIKRTSLQIFWINFIFGYTEKYIIEQPLNKHIMKEKTSPHTSDVVFDRKQ